jgi:DNA polymerase III psi subunit
MLDSLSIEQKIAFDALNLGPVWVNKVGSEQVPTVALGLVFLSTVESHSEAQNRLIEQILRAAKLPFEQADALHITSLKHGAQFETLLSFGASDEIDALRDKHAIKTAARIDLPSLAAIAGESQAKAKAWKAVKAFLLGRH